MRVTVLIAFLLAVLNAGRAQTNLTSGTQPITLQQCIQLALQHNFDLQIERYNPKVSVFNLNAAYAGYDPIFSIAGQHDYSETSGGFDPTTGLPRPASKIDDNAFSSSISGGLTPWGMNYTLAGNIAETFGSSAGIPIDQTRGGVSVSVSQPLLKNFWIDNTRLNIAVAKNRLKFTDLSLRSRLISTVTSVELAYYDLIAAYESIKVQEKALQLAEQLLAEDKKKVEVGSLAPLDEKQAESQVASARADLLAAHQTFDLRENTLKFLVSEDYARIHGLILEPMESLEAQVQSFDLQDSWNKGLTVRPDLLQAKLDLERQGIVLKYDHNQLFPQLDVFGTYGHGASGVREFYQGFDQFGNGDNPYWTYGARLSIPLASVSARNNYKSTKVSIEQSLLALKKLEQSIMVDIDNAVKVAQSSYQRVDATHAARLYAEAALEAEQKKLENGKSTNFEVLSLQSSLTLARSAEIGALADYNKALSALAQFEGTTLERRKIDVQVTDPVAMLPKSNGK